MFRCLDHLGKGSDGVCMAALTDVLQVGPGAIHGPGTMHTAAGVAAMLQASLTCSLQKI